MIKNRKMTSRMMPMEPISSGTLVISASIGREVICIKEIA